MRRFAIINLLLLLIVAAILFEGTHCPPQGFAFTPAKRSFNSLKNRHALPQEMDFDKRVTLAALVEAGDDRARWSNQRAAFVEGYVIAVSDGSIESANCFCLAERDTHLEIALRRDAPPRERMILEVTPRIREWAQSRGIDWSTSALERELIGHRCRFEGWLLFDIGHAEESENTSTGKAINWRATAWELHPVTAIQVRE